MSNDKKLFPHLYLCDVDVCTNQTQKRLAKIFLKHQHQHSLRRKHTTLIFTFLKSLTTKGTILFECKGLSGLNSPQSLARGDSSGLSHKNAFP